LRKELPVASTPSYKAHAQQEPSELLKNQSSAKALMSPKRPIITDMKKVDNKTVEGDGFVIMVPDIHHVRYVQGAVEATVEIEGGSEGGQIDWLIYSATLTGISETDSGFVHSHRQEIIDRISNALTILAMQHRVA
jgi:hypothetical protein